MTICFVDNGVRVDATGAWFSTIGIVASRSEDHLVATPNGWLPDGGFEDTWQGLGVTRMSARLAAACSSRHSSWRARWCSPTDR